MSDSTQADLRVDIVSDVVCPWCIIGFSQLKVAADALGKTLDVHWHPFELNPQMSPEGQNLREHISEKYGSSAEESAQIRDRITELGAELGFQFNFTPESRIMNTMQAHKLIKWAGQHGQQHAMKMVLIRRYFTEGQDVSDPAVLRQAVEEVGLNTEEAQRVILDETLSKDIREDEHFWLSKGVQGVPSMVFEQRHLVTGAQGVETYKSIIEQLTAAKAQ